MRAKKYSPKAFREAVTRYFRRRNFNELQLFHDRSSDEWIPVITEDENGEKKPMYIERYARPVTLIGLCKELGITRASFENYARDERYKDVCDRALVKIEAYLTECVIEGRGSVSGIKFIMQNSYDMKEKVEVEQSGGSLTDRLKAAEEALKKMKNEE